MSGPIRKLGSADAITATSGAGTGDIRGGKRAWSNKLFFVDVTAVAGTWTMTLRWTPDGSTFTVLGTATGIDSTGIKAVTIDADFSSAAEAMPEPNDLVWVEAAAGTLSADVYGMFA